MAIAPHDHDLGGGGGGELTVGDINRHRPLQPAPLVFGFGMRLIIVWGRGADVTGSPGPM